MTRAYYEANAAAYAAATAAAEMRWQHRAFVERVGSNALVLDAGCGGGRDLRSFQMAGLRPIGLDYSPALLAVARQHAFVPLIVGDLRHLPFADAVFDGVWAAASLLHLKRDEVGEALGGLRRVLKPGALLFSSVKAGKGEERDQRGRWFTYYSAAEWQRVLEEAGFTEVVVHKDRESREQQVGEIVEVQWLSAFCCAPSPP